MQLQRSPPHAGEAGEGSSHRVIALTRIGAGGAMALLVVLVAKGHPSLDGRLHQPMGGAGTGACVVAGSRRVLDQQWSVKAQGCWSRIWAVARCRSWTAARRCRSHGHTSRDGVGEARMTGGSWYGGSRGDDVHVPAWACTVNLSRTDGSVRGVDASQCLGGPETT